MWFQIDKYAYGPKFVKIKLLTILLLCVIRGLYLALTAESYPKRIKVRNKFEFFEASIIYIIIITNQMNPRNNILQVTTFHLV